MILTKYIFDSAAETLSLLLLPRFIVILSDSEGSQTLDTSLSLRMTQELLQCLNVDFWLFPAESYLDNLQKIICGIRHTTLCFILHYCELSTT